VAAVRAVTIQAEALSRQHMLRLEVPETALVGRFDRDRLSQVLQNLLVNAIKYSPAGGTVTVRVEAHGPEAWVTVSDEGMGIPAEELGQLFERFYRTKAAVAGQIKGLGLGLYICRRLVEAHDGRIWVESMVGHGTTVVVSLPYEPGDTGDAGAAQ
jgi:two-component system sensor histidine kinase VicK